MSNIIAIAAGSYHSMALRSDGTVFSCGYNRFGQLGNNTTTNKNSFIQAVGVSNILSISTIDKYGVILRSDGLSFSCGYNVWGQLGNFLPGHRSTYTQTLSS
jgi:alpha-tubulin suppressor-like RCC1 family protein